MSVERVEVRTMLLAPVSRAPGPLRRVRRRTLVVGLCLAVATVLFGVPVATPAAAACPAADDAPQAMRSPTRTAGTVSFTGGGWGHGLGMSQYGALGAASLGCGHGQILGTYYPGTSLRTRSDLDRLRVGLVFGGATTVTSSTLTNTGSSNVVFQQGGTRIGAVAPGRDVGVTMAASQRVRLDFGGGDTWTQPSTGTTTVTAALSATRRLRVAGTSGLYDRGQFRIEVARQSSGRFEHVVDLPMEDYLLGLAEMPYGWPAAALRAQAVAGRSYAQATSSGRGDCTCTIYDSVRSQVWRGGDMQDQPSWSRWRDAVSATTGQVVETTSGTVATTFYSSSNGGVSQDLAHAWGSANVDYLRPVNTARWDNAAAGSNSRHRWVDDLAAGEVAADHGIAVLHSVVVDERTTLGRAARVRLVGWDADGRTVTRLVRRDSDIRGEFGLYSNYTDVRYTHGSRRRVFGSTRYDTAVEAARTGWPDGADAVVVARGDDPADALGGVTLAGAEDAPLLLARRGGLTDATSEEVQRLRATTAFVLGGTGALSDGVVADLRAAGVTDVVRVAGPNRFATMADVAGRTADRVGTTAFVVRAQGPGDDWADALAVSGVAARRAADGTVSPVLGVGTSGIPTATRDALGELGISDVVIVGGTGVVSGRQAAALTDMGLVVDRWSGANRWETSLEVAGREPGPARDVLLATGDDFPDGLAAGALAARLDATLLVVPRHYDTSRSPWRPGDLPALLSGLAPARNRATAMGGSAAVPLRTVAAVSWYLTPGAGAPGSPAARASTAGPHPSADDTVGSPTGSVGHPTDLPPT